MYKCGFVNFSIIKDDKRFVSYHLPFAVYTVHFFFLFLYYHNIMHSKIICNDFKN